ncbi:MAG: hypothetical protein IJ337_02775 [Clostridia bacterium]|nr:hypothetical protein [Clostridia bacterium]
MAACSAALALLGGVIGAGFASGREILHFFACHGNMAPAAVLAACITLAALFLRLPALMQQSGSVSLAALCRFRLGPRFGRLCTALFALLCAITGAAMLTACAELGALLLPIRHAYGISLFGSLLFCCMLSAHGLSGVALPGALLCALLPLLLVRLWALPTGEACFLAAMSPDLPVHAFSGGVAYGALSAAQLAGLLAPLACEDARTRRNAVVLFTLLFGVLVSLGTAVCRRHLPALVHQPLPFVHLSRSLGASGYVLVALCMYAAALSTLCAMLHALMQLFPLGILRSACLAALCCLIPAAAGFDTLIRCGYPMLGALCAGLLGVLCLPVCPKANKADM